METERSVDLFETTRLIVKELSSRDIPALTEILSDPAVMQYSLRGVCDEAATRQFIGWCMDCYSSCGFGPWALFEKTSGDLVGFCGVGPERVGDVEEINLGYRLARRFWGQGLATEAVRGVMQYAFEQKRCASVIVIIEPEHTASVRVTEKSGFGAYTVREFHGRQVRLYRMTDRVWRSRVSDTADA